MPSSPKFSYSRLSPPATRLTRSTLLLVFSVVSFLFAAYTLISSSGCGYRCLSDQRTVRVLWDRPGVVHNSGAAGGDVANGIKRHKVMGFVGIQTGFRSAGRRRSLRKTWMPSDRQGLRRLEESTGLAFRFIIGRTNDKSKMEELGKEVAEYDDFILLDIEEKYSKLPYKTLAFFKAAYALYDSDFYIKADDDIYLRPDRLSLLIAKERSHPQTYLGCMKKGPVFTSPKLKWYEPLSRLLGSEYFLHAYGPLYALSADGVASLVALQNNSFRMFSNEDVTIGAWMLAMNVNHEHNWNLCEKFCSSTSIAVWDIPKCSGLCNTEAKLLELHQQEICSNSSILLSDEK
ncbi:hypothetical protein GQ457_13G004190 [Hibiscus cannabinus]